MFIEHAYRNHELRHNFGKPGDEFQGYTLARSGTRAYSCVILGTPEGIVIVGDAVPCKMPVEAIVARGKSLAWFAGELSPDYLAEKFLWKEFCPDAAKAAVLEHASFRAEEAGFWCENIENDPSEGAPTNFPDCECENCKAFFSLIEFAADVSEMTEAEFCDALIQRGYSPSDWDECWCYNDRMVAHLTAIQKKFREGYHARWTTT